MKTTKMKHEPIQLPFPSGVLRTGVGMQIVLAVLALFVFAQAPAAQTYSGKVVGVSDGDTITVLADRKPLKVRLAEIDTPEKGQPYGTRAKQALSELVFGKDVAVTRQSIDRYGRMVAHVNVNGVDVNAEMIRGGHAWVYRQYVTDGKLYHLEREAKQARRGLWALPVAEQIPPWEWRRGGRTATPAATVPQEAAGIDHKCGEKRYCREMTTCKEARFYLVSCDVRRLDGDGDGIPCETLCR